MHFSYLAAAALALLCATIFFGWRRRPGQKSSPEKTKLSRTNSVAERASLDLNEAPAQPEVQSTPPVDPRPSSSSKTSPTNSADAAKDEDIPAAYQPFDAFLVVDFEGTCEQGSTFDYPNEIIEFPIVLARWEDKMASGPSRGHAKKLSIVAEFHTFVRPTWRPKLTPFCTELTGITQEDVDHAPQFTAVLSRVKDFLISHGLIDSTGKVLTKYCWVTDGPWDFRDHLVKQCFMSKIEMPNYMRNNIVDSRKLVHGYLYSKYDRRCKQRLNLVQQLECLDLSFEGRLHSGLADTRNVFRLTAELARRAVQLLPNVLIDTSRRWPWMGKKGKVIKNKI
ncbi:hypothetical protein CYLTODRAFT_424693 [Cylindrobasidium torrendii FP15055 ss-10]|uniref:Exonuclease domain-containing protein n=1 Tax=Cylindrobasidium torrendii FP15055 ss-10 TaxID=1314674 RepID=A0A0D7B3G8_9AGAR|nr:hypothetical protein CYLTODRAFT_424693 [Cylindrobasidium torrendii FP15055 ss-10]